MNCPKPVDSATALPSPPLDRETASTTRIRNQRRATTAVAGLCNPRHLGHLLGYARVSTADQQPHLQVDEFERASGTLTNRPTLEQILDLRAQATAWWSGSWTGWAGRCATESTSSPGWPRGGSGSAACRSKSIPPAQAARSSSRCSRHWPSSSAPHPRTHQRRAGRRPRRGRRGGRRRR
jgi:hypothetical protein